jgi:hypothetical protein
MAHKVTFTVTVEDGHAKSFRLQVNNQTIHIPIDGKTLANFQNQFVRTNPTEAYKARWATLFALLRLAYNKGLIDGKNA